MKVGIDFGTTTCTIGNLLGDGRRSIHSGIPSIGAWKNGEIVFGTDAREMLRSEDTDVFPVRDLKLLLGQTDNLRFGHTPVPVIDLAAGLFRKLASIQSPESRIDSAVIATPISVSMKHRLALREAAARAGISDVSLIYEPTAALIGAQRLQPLDVSGLFLVIDWGGGTLDIAVVKSDGERYEELAVGGDVSSLGGTCIDQEIMQRLLDQNNQIRRAVNEIPGGMDRLRDEVEELKLAVLESFDGIDGEVQESAPLWLNDIIELEPAAVYEVIMEFTDRAVSQILDKLSSAGISPGKIHHVLFAGGVCKAPEIKTRIMKEFPNAHQITEVAGASYPLLPQELTGAGCTEITDKRMTVELATNIGIRQCDDSVCVMLGKGLPVEIGTFRKAEFVVTNPESPEAVLDIGIARGEPGEIELMGWKAERFESMYQMFIPVGSYIDGRHKPAADWLHVGVGVSENLAILVTAEARMLGTHQQKSVTGIPLVLRFINA